MRIFHGSVLSLAGAALLLAGGASTAADIEEVVVTATKRESTIQDVPFSINAQTQQDIQRTGAGTLEELARNVAGLTIQNLGPGQSQVAIRGVSAGQIVRDQPGVKEQVGVYMDESVISLSLFTPDFDLFDLNRVETLRGPQGTLFGSGSIGGTIRYITNDPEFDAFDGSVELSLNSITEGGTGGHVKGMVNVPISDTAALRAVGYTTEYGGFIDAFMESGGKISDVNSGNRTGGRVAIAFRPNDSLTITPRVIYQEIDMDGFNRQEVFNLFANPYTTTRPPVQLDEHEQHLLLREGFTDETMLADLSVEASFSAVDLTFIGSVMDREILVSRDASALTGSVSVDLEYAPEDVALASNLRDTTDLKQSTYELRLNSNNDSGFQWLAGLFWADMEREYAQRLPTPGYAAATDAVFGEGTSAAVANGFPNLDSPFNSDLPYDIEQLAVFGEVTFDPSDTIHLTIGGRWYDFDETRTITSGGLFANGDSGTVNKTSSDGFTPRVLASFDVGDNITVNAQASQGFRLGGVNDPLNPGLCTPEDELIFGSFQDYSDEKLWNYEVGVKSRIGGRTTFNAAVFYADIEDLQVTLDAGSCSSRISFNVSDSHSSGAEFELIGSASDSFEYSLAGSIIESEFDTTVEDALGSILGGVEDGNRLASVPEFQVAATGTWLFPLFGGDGYVTAAVQYVGDRITQPSDQVSGSGDFASGLPFGGATGDDVTSLDLELDPYTVAHLSAGVVRNAWEAVIYISNLTDENADLSFDRERGGRARLAFRTNQPRTAGVTFRMNFGD